MKKTIQNYLNENVPGSGDYIQGEYYIRFELGGELEVNCEFDPRVVWVNMFEDKIK